MPTQVITDVDVCGSVKPIGVQSGQYVITDIKNPDTEEPYTLTQWMTDGIGVNEDEELFYINNCE